MVRQCSSMTDRCIFCRIIGGHDPTGIVYEDDVAVGILDHRPLFPGHTLVLPRLHIETLADLPPDLVGPFWRRVQHLSAELPRLLGAEGTFVANNNRVSQSVPHLHVHVVPRRRGDGLRGFFWPRTKYGPGEAETLAERLREGIAPLDDAASADRATATRHPPTD
jgi:histidine triad (HIT) family protein